MLFVVETDSLLVMLQEMGMCATMFSGEFAIAPGWEETDDPNRLRDHMQECISEIAEWCGKRNFVINDRKSAYTVFRRPKLLGFNLEIRNTLIARDSCPKYLGIAMGRQFGVSKNGV